MPNSPRHPAFYASRRQLWSTLPGTKPRWIYRCIRQTGLGTNCDSLLDVWYTLFLTSSTIWLILVGVWRYREFKAQAYDPRYGGAWNEAATLHIQLAALIVAFAILPVMVYSSVAHTGHLANDAIILGRDLLHLQRAFSGCAIAQRLWKPTGAGSHGRNESRNTNRSHGASLGDDDLDTLLVKRRGKDCYAWTLHAIRPFSTILFVLVVYVLLLPTCVLEAEQIRNEAIDPIYVLHSELDSIFGKPKLMEQLERSRIQSNIEFRIDHQNERPFPSHSYPVTPPQVGVEFAIFAMSLGLLTVRYAMSFYFTSRVFSSLFSAFIALTSVFLAIDSATVAVVYKLFSIGVREPGGAILIEMGDHEKVLSPWQCLCMSVAGLPAILINLMAVYAYGEEQFSRAVTNYAQLLISGELPPSRSARVGDPNKIRCNSGLPSECGGNDCLENNGLFGAADRGTLEDMEMDGIREALYGWPLTIAVTTKYWRPPPSQSTRRSARALKRANTPILGQYPSNDSEASSTLKRLPEPNMASGSADNSVHTLTDSSEANKVNPNKRSNLGLLIVAAISFVWFLITRICLAAPFLRCLWKTGLHLILINVIVTVLYLVVWLLLWFGLGVKNAWRFRLLHTTWPFWSRPNSMTGQTMENGQVACGPDGQTPMTCHPLQTAYPALWPYMPYAPWVTSTASGGMSAGLPLGETGEINPLPVPLSNGNAGMHEAGSGGDSLYGCFAEITPAGRTAASPGVDQYQTHLSTAILRAGPPTVSDDSEALPEPGDHLDGSSRYFKPVQQSVSYHNGHVASGNHRTSTHQSVTPSPFQNVQYECSSRGNSPVDCGAIPTSASTNVHQRIQNLPISQSMLFRQGRMNDGAEPTYATLTTLSRPTGRAPSATPESRGQTPVSGMMPHQSSYRRNGSRVTFKDHNNDQNTLRSVHHQQQQQHQQQAQQPDAATGSSDSGVYTNGHGINGNSDRPVQRGRLKPELFAIYGNARAPTAGRSTSHKTIQSTYCQNLGPGAEDGEISTDMTSFGAVNGQRTENVMTRSSDQLCSQV